MSTRLVPPVVDPGTHPESGFAVAHAAAETGDPPARPTSAPSARDFACRLHSCSLDGAHLGIGVKAPVDPTDNGRCPARLCAEADGKAALPRHPQAERSVDLSFSSLSRCSPLFLGLNSGDAVAFVGDGFVLEDECDVLKPDQRRRRFSSGRCGSLRNRVGLLLHLVPFHDRVEWGLGVEDAVFLRVDVSDISVVRARARGRKR